jgi:hypothetical protein
MLCLLSRVGVIIPQHVPSKNVEFQLQKLEAITMAGWMYRWLGRRRGVVVSS